MSDLVNRCVAGQGFGRSAAWRHVRTRPDSVVVELVSSTGKGVRELVLKVHRDRPAQSAQPDERARKEAAALRLLDRHLARTDGVALDSAPVARRLQVPEVLHLDLERGAILMNRCDGFSLDRRIRDARRRLGRSAMNVLASDIRDAGRWLQQFQDCTPLVGETGVPAGTALERALGALRTCEQAGDLVSDSPLIRTTL